VSFGHFGDTDIVADGLARARAYAKLMNNASQPGAFAFADAGYFVEVMANNPAMLDDLRILYDETAHKQAAALGNRFMYGTDWEMTLTEGAVDSYLNDFVTLMRELQSRPALRAERLQDLSSKFFGGNAVDWIGLRAGQKARERLEAFYAANKVPRPDWATKVDGR
jgi:hypothetical protein